MGTSSRWERPPALELKMSEFELLWRIWMREWSGLRECVVLRRRVGVWLEEESLTMERGGRGIEWREEAELEEWSLLFSSSTSTSRSSSC